MQEPDWENLRRKYLCTLLTIAASHVVHVQIPAPLAQLLWMMASAVTLSATLALTAAPAQIPAPWAQSLLNNQYLNQNLWGDMLAYRLLDF